jgi:putative peptidoglycan lipid II flippase
MLALGAVYAGSRGLGLIREVGVAYFFGTSPIADRWAAAFVVAGLASTMTGEAAYAVSVRWLGEQTRTTGGGLDELTYARLLRLVGRAVVAVSLVYLFIGPVTSLLVVGHWGQSIPQTILLSVSLLPSVAANMFASAVEARLTFERRFVLINMAQTLYSAGSLVGLAVIAVAGRSLGPEPVALGWSAGNVAAVIMVYIAAPSKVPPGSDFAGMSRDLLRIGIPIAIAYSLTSVQGLTDQTVAGRLGTGSVAAFAYANRLMLLPLGFVLSTLGPIVLGALTTARRQGYDTLARSSQRQMIRLTRVFAPVSVLFAGAVPLLVAHVFEYGAFNGRSSASTTAALDGFAVGIAAIAMTLIFFRAMQSVTQLRLIVFVCAAAVLINLILSVIFAVLLGIYGDTLATSITSFITMLLQVRGLSGPLGRRWERDIIKNTIIPVFVACLLALSVVTATRAHVLNQVTALVAGLALAVALYAYMTLRTGSD